MKNQDMIDAILKVSSHLGTFLLPDVIGFAEKCGINGITVSKGNEKLQYRAILAGEPEGAIFIDENGTHYGDKAVMLFSDKESFTPMMSIPTWSRWCLSGAASLKSPT